MRKIIDGISIAAILVLSLLFIDQWKKREFWHAAFETQTIFNAVFTVEVQENPSDVVKAASAADKFFELWMEKKGQLNATKKMMRTEREALAKTTTPYQPSPGLWPDRIGIF